MKHLALATLAVGTALPALVAAQVTTVDEGSFTITANGTRVGREDFRIRSTPTATGRELLSTATVSYGGRRVVVQMRSDAEGVPSRYVVDVKTGPGTDEHVEGMVGRSRVSARVTSPRGESANEFVVSPRAIVIDDDVFHQYYFIAHRGDQAAGPVSVIVPRRNAQVAMRVNVAGTEKVSIGGTSIDAQRYTVSDPGGADRELWADSAGRVLRVAIPSKGIVATRDEPPH